MRLARTLGLAAGLAMVGSMTLAGGASAEPIENVEYRDGFDDFCGVSGLTVQLERVIDGRILINPHGPDGLAYSLDSTASPPCSRTSTTATR
jgi:hypothetical protein